MNFTYCYQSYSEKESIDILNDGSGFSSGPICVSPDELQELAVKMGELVKPYRENQPARGRKMHTVALIFTPPQEL